MTSPSVRNASSGCCARSSWSICRWRRCGQQDRPNLDRNKAALEEVCRQIDPTSSTREVSDRLREHHPTPEGLLPATRDVLGSLRAFIIERDIVGVPSSVPATVAETLPFHRWGFASMDSPGAFETRGRRTRTTT